MKPMHTAAKREWKGAAGWAGARRNRQRIARRGKVAVVTATERRRSRRSAVRMCSHTTAGSSFRKSHQNRIATMATPTGMIHLPRTGLFATRSSDTAPPVAARGPCTAC